MNKYNKSDIAKIVFVIVAVLLIISSMVCDICTSFNDHYETITIVDKGIKNTSDSSQYLIYGKKLDGTIETYKISDSWLRGQFDSSNKYGAIQVGTEYRIKLIGIRVPILSWYENIIECEVN